MLPRFWEVGYRPTVNKVIFRVLTFCNFSGSRIASPLQAGVAQTAEGRLCLLLELELYNEIHHVNGDRYQFGQ